MADKKEIKSVRITQRNPFKYYSYNGDEPFSPENKEEIAKFDEAGVSPSSIEDGCKLTIFEEGRFKKAILIPPYTFNLKKSRKKDELVIYKGSSAESDADVLNAALDKLSNDDEYSQYPKNGTRIRYKVLQDPYKDQSPLKRESYGSGNYYLNNGCKINILWIGYNSNTVFSKTDENNKDVSKKEVKVFPPSDGRVKIDGYYVYHKDDKFMYSVGSNFSDYGYFANYYTDYEIVQNIINKLKFAHLKHKENSDWKANFDKLALCDPDTEFCSLIPFVDFLSSPQTPEPPQAPTASETPVSPGSTASGEKPKAPIKITSDKSITDKNNPNDLVLKALTNFEFKLSIGTKPAVAPGATANGQADDFDNSEKADDEFYEEPLQIDEVKLLDTIDKETIIIQRDVGRSQQDSTLNETKEIPGKVDIQKVSTEDDIYQLAGKLARQLGKNEKIKYENLKIGYNKDIHGLCPQGTQVILAALIGIPKLGKISGNADWFSFKNPSTGGGKAGFNITIDGKVYYEDKVQISQINGSWKDTYLDPKSRSKWQVGDIIAMGYDSSFNGGKYGHIQIWTGYSWNSDFRQGDKIHQKGLDLNSVALWRLNKDGIEAVNSQSNRSS